MYVNVLFFLLKRLEKVGFHDIPFNFNRFMDILYACERPHILDRSVMLDVQ